MKLVDVHCHLEAEVLAPDLDRILEDARQAGIVALVTAAVEPSEWALSESLAQHYPQVEFAWGIHPWYIKEEYQADLGTLCRAREHGAKAIGEIGLDAKIETPGMALQQPFFEDQLRIAKEIDLPVVLHCRGAFNELLETLRRVGAPARGGLVHSFSGSVEVAEACMEHGLRFSMGGVLSYRPSKKRTRVLQRIYPDHFLLETDSPDIPPVQAEKPNVPANIRYNLQGAAAILGESEEAIAEITTRNAQQLFDLALS